MFSYNMRTSYEYRLPTVTDNHVLAQKCTLKFAIFVHKSLKTVKRTSCALSLTTACESIHLFLKKNANIVGTVYAAICL